MILPVIPIIYLILSISRVDEGFKSSYFLADNVINSSKESAFIQAFDVTGNFFSWLEEPNNEFRKFRFGKAMEGTQMIERPDAILAGESTIQLA